jgi:hypothetical protein
MDFRSASFSTWLIGLAIDTLNSGSGNDTLDGGLGNDNLGLAVSAAMYWCAMPAQAPSRSTLARAQAAVRRATMRPAGIENIQGGDGADSLVGDSLSNILAGGAGDDTLRWWRRPGHLPLAVPAMTACLPVAAAAIAGFPMLS